MTTPVSEQKVSPAPTISITSLVNDLVASVARWETCLCAEDSRVCAHKLDYEKARRKLDTRVASLESQLEEARRREREALDALEYQTNRTSTCEAIAHEYERQLDDMAFLEGTTELRKDAEGWVVFHPLTDSGALATVHGQTLQQAAGNLRAALAADSARGAPHER